jgi:hypothetical protein
MGIFDGIKKVAHFIFDSMEVLTMVKVAKDVFAGKNQKGKEAGTADASKESNMFGFGCEDELRYILSYWEKLPANKKNQDLPEKNVNKIIEVIGTLPERAQSKMVLILGLREKSEEIDKKNNPDKKEGGEKNGKFQKPLVITKEIVITKTMRNADGAKCLEVFSYLLENGGEEALIAFIRNGIISEPAKQFKEAIDAFEDVAGHLLSTLGLDQNELELINNDLEAKILATRKRRSEKKLLRLQKEAVKLKI